MCIRDRTRIDWDIYGLRTSFIIFFTFVFVLIHFYSEERKMREVYLQKYLHEKTLKDMEHIFSKALPVSVLILNQRTKSESELKFSNESAQREFGNRMRNTNELLEQILIPLDSIIEDEMRANLAWNDGENTNLASILEIANGWDNLRVFLDCKSEGPDHTRFYDIHVVSCTWNRESCICVTFSHITQEVIQHRLRRFEQYKDKLLASISHNLKTPLNGILGMQQMALNEIRGQTHVADYLHKAETSVHLLKYMINDILDLSKVNEGGLKANSTRVEISKIIKDMKAFFEHQAESKRLKLIFDEKFSCKKIRTDVDRLKQILINLMSNAFKFTFKGRITLTVSEESVDSNLLRFTVEDTGIGINEKDVDLAFNMFRRISKTLERSEGIGLGLTISKELVGLLGPEKKIYVKSMWGKGSCFSFLIYKDLLARTRSSSRVFRHDEETRSPKTIEADLADFDPLTFEEFGHPNEVGNQFSDILDSSLDQLLLKRVPRSYQCNQSLLTRRRRKKEILIVDDTVFNIEVLENYLRHESVIISRAFNGQEAVKEVRKRGASLGHQFALIFMDCNMPILDGYEATTILKTLMREGEIPDIPIIGVSAYFENGKDEKARRCGMDEALSKPCSRDQILGVFKKWVT
eukprot:TRINITY_DN13174_c0_g1_i1.p1 TRINITY_DN13174_c0_g1~~TRINITY_DN13174_c0_g1_i1.p1  ORF type:complete len:637 (-),score=101.53 TRINITY_DN13174_c0_g1_i1:162-2072(-)